MKAGGKYVLKNDTMTYELDDQVKARQFEGKQVSVMGDLDQVDQRYPCHRYHDARPEITFIRTVLH